MVASLWVWIAGLHFSQVCPFQTNHVERTGKGTRSSRKPRPWRDVIEKKVVKSQAGHKNVMQYLYVSMSFCRAKKQNLVCHSVNIKREKHNTVSNDISTFFIPSSDIVFEKLEVRIKHANKLVVLFSVGVFSAYQKYMYIGCGQPHKFVIFLIFVF